MQRVTIDPDVGVDTSRNAMIIGPSHSLRAIRGQRTVDISRMRVSLLLDGDHSTRLREAMAMQTLNAGIVQCPTT